MFPCPGPSTTKGRLATTVLAICAAVLLFLLPGAVVRRTLLLPSDTRHLQDLVIQLQYRIDQLQRSPTQASPAAELHCERRLQQLRSKIARLRDDHRELVRALLVGEEADGAEDNFLGLPPTSLWEDLANEKPLQSQQRQLVVDAGGDDGGGAEAEAQQRSARASWWVEKSDALQIAESRGGAHAHLGSCLCLDRLTESYFCPADRSNISHWHLVRKHMSFVGLAGEARAKVTDPHEAELMRHPQWFCDKLQTNLLPWVDPIEYQHHTRRAAHREAARLIAQRLKRPVHDDGESMGTYYEKAPLGPTFDVNERGDAAAEVELPPEARNLSAQELIAIVHPDRKRTLRYKNFWRDAPLSEQLRLLQRRYSKHDNDVRPNPTLWGQLLDGSAEHLLRDSDEDFRPLTAKDIGVAIYTGENIFHSRAYAVRDTWLPRFGLWNIYASSGHETVPVVGVKELYPNVTGSDVTRVNLYAFHHMYKQNPNLKWYGTWGCDTYLASDYLVKHLSHFDPEQPLWLTAGAWVDGPAMAEMPNFDPLPYNATWYMGRSKESYWWSSGAFGWFLSNKAAKVMADGIELLLSRLKGNKLPCPCPDKLVGLLLSLEGFVPYRLPHKMAQGQLAYAVDSKGTRSDVTTENTLYHYVTPRKMLAIDQRLQHEKLDRLVNARRVDLIVSFFREFIDQHYDTLRRKQGDVRWLVENKGHSQGRFQAYDIGPDI